MNEERHRSRGDGGADAFAGFASRVDLAVSWASLSLSSSDSERLRELAAKARRAMQVAGSGRPPRPRVALVGGDAKRRTQVAAAIANEVGLGLFRVDLAAVASKYTGETEKNLARLLDAARSSAAVLLFDESDALFGEPTEADAAGHGDAGLDREDFFKRLEACDAWVIFGASDAARAQEVRSRHLDCVVHLGG
jgi:hypothetical protein